MCGILGIVARSPVNQLLYDGLLLLQHRGQDAAGIVTSDQNMLHMHKGSGMVRDVFRTRNMRDLAGNIGIAHSRTEYMVASESVAGDGLGFRLLRDIGPGEAVFIDDEGNFHSQQCAEQSSLNPCIFEYVYLARPDSLIDGASVYEARLNMGEKLAEKIRRQHPGLEIDVVIPIPDSSRPSGLQLATALGVPYREGFVKNRYIGRTLIMPGQAVRKRSVRQKLNPMPMEFAGKNVLLVDDSIVRGTTSREIVQMARESGARKVFFASAAPPVRFPNVYGIDMPTRAELIAAHRSEEEVGREIGADALIYQDLEELKDAVRRANPRLANFETSCFDGIYVTGDVTTDYLSAIERQRDASRDSADEDTAKLDLNLAA